MDDPSLLLQEFLQWKSGREGSSSTDATSGSADHDPGPSSPVHEDITAELDQTVESLSTTATEYLKKGKGTKSSIPFKNFHVSLGAGDK